MEEKGDQLQVSRIWTHYMWYSRSNLSLSESSQVPCSGNPLFQYNSLNKELEIIKSRGNLLGQIQFSGSSEKLIVDQTVCLSQIKNPLQIKPLETVENSREWLSLALDDIFCLWDNKMQGIGTGALDAWINFEISLSLRPQKILQRLAWQIIL